MHLPNLYYFIFLYTCLLFCNNSQFQTLKISYWYPQFLPTILCQFSMYTLHGWVNLLYPVLLQVTPCHQKFPSRLSTSYPLAINVLFQAASLLSRGWVGIVIIKLRIGSVQLALDCEMDLSLTISLGQCLMPGTISLGQGLKFFWTNKHIKHTKRNAQSHILRQYAA